MTGQTRSHEPVADTAPKLTPGSPADQIYCWLSFENDYRLPADLAAALEEYPEKESTRAIASFGEDGFRRSLAYMGPVFSDPDYGTLSLIEREFIGVVVSSINHCVSCLINHGYALGVLIQDQARARRLAINYRSVALSPRERAIGDFAAKLTETPGKSEAADLDRLRGVGLSEADIFHAAELTALFNLTNRFTSSLGLRPDNEFLESIHPGERLSI